MIHLFKKIILNAPKIISGFLIVVVVLTSTLIPGVPGVFGLGTKKVEAAFNKEINYQGKLTNASNVAVSDGTYLMKFWLLTSPTAATTTAIWAEDRATAPGDRATVSNGLFSIMLGSSTPLTSVDFNQTLYLGVEVCGTVSLAGCDGEMTPRKKLGAVPAAFEADKLDGLSSEQFLRSDAVNSTSTATTWLTFTQNGAGNIAEFIGPSSAPVFNVQSGSSRVVVGTSTAYSRFTVWGGGTGTGQLANFVNSASTSVMTLLDNGKVGIGTTSPPDNLVISSGSPVFSIYDTIGDKRFSITNAGDIISLAFGGTTLVESDGTSYTSLLAPGSTGHLGFWANNTEYLRLTSGGLFGVGTTTPNNKLDIYSTTKSAIGFSGAAGTTYKWTMGMDVSNGGRFSIASSTALGTLDRFVIDGNGNVGIGTTSPYAKLSVVGQTVAEYFTATSTTIASTFPYASTTSFTSSGAAYVGSLTSSGSISIPFNSSLILGPSTGLTITPTGGGTIDFTNLAGGTPLAINLSTNRVTVGSSLTIGSLTGPLQAINGAVTASSTLSVAYGGTGVSSFGQGWIYSSGSAGALAASTSPTVNYLTSTSTSATSTFAYDTSITGRLSVLQSSTLATIIGDTTGAARGTSALDIQSTRSASTQVASGLNAIAFGINNTSSGDYSQTFGYGNSATGFSEDPSSGSIAIGQSNSATGQNSYAFGASNVASGFTSVAFGRRNTASAAAGSASAIGVSNTASGAGSVAVGDSNTSAGLTSSAMGYTNLALGDASLSYGYLNKGYTLNSVLVGNRNYSSIGGLGSVALGFLNNQTGATLDTTTGVVSGTATGTATVGAVSSAVGILNTVSANLGQAFGFKNTVSATNASAFGSYITNSMASSTQIGPYDTSKLTIRGDTGYEGFVGIGTTTPNNMLDIYSTTKSAIGFSGASGSAYKWTIGMDVSNGGRFSIASSTALGTLDRFVIDGDGDIGIGTSTPSYRFHLAGTATAHNAKIDTGMILSRVARPTGFTAALAGVGAGNVNTGDHYYYISYVTDRGETELSIGNGGHTFSGSSGVLVTTTAGNGQVNVNVTASTDYRVTGIKIYRAATGASFWANVKLVTTLSNATQTYLDNIADASLTGSNAYVRENTTNDQIYVDGYKAIFLGSGNSTVGLQAGEDLTIGGSNTLFGSQAGMNLTTGGSNVIMGLLAGATMTSGSQNIAIGQYSMYLGNGVENTGMGYSALYGTTGNYNVGIGSSAGAASAAISNGISIGYYAGKYETASSKLFIDSFNRSTEAAGRTSAIIYGVMSSTAANQTLSLGGGGKVGIGTTTPTWTLNPFSSSAAQLALSEGAGVSQWAFRNAGGNLYFASTTVAGSATTTLPAFTIIGSNGNVGIASSTPWRRLSVNGTVAFNGLTSDSTGNAVCIASTKDITDAGGGSCAVSSIRFKENVETLSGGFALAKLSQLRVVSFDYREGAYSPEDHRESYGLIAEEVEEIDPNLVDYGYDGRPLTLKFEKILGLAVQSIQELNARVTALEGGGFAGGGNGGGISPMNLNAILESLSNLGVRISNGLAVFKNLVVETLTIGSTEKPSGITLYDEVTGKPYCVKIANGKLKNVSGKCEDGVDSEDVAPVDENPPVRSSSGSVSATTTASQSAPVINDEEGTGPNIESGPGPSDLPGEISTPSEPKTESEGSDEERSSEPEPAPEPESSPESSG